MNGSASKNMCPMCGFRNEGDLARCVSCGAKLEPLSAADRTAEEEASQRNQQEGFEWKWVGISVAIYLLLQGVVLGVLPFVIDQYDPEGFAGLAISVGLWFVGGVVVGVVSPGKTFLEPAVGALLAVIPTVGYLMWYSQVRELSMLGYVVGGLLGVMVTLFGAFLGERVQMARA